MDKLWQLIQSLSDSAAEYSSKNNETRYDAALMLEELETF